MKLSEIIALYKRHLDFGELKKIMTEGIRNENIYFANITPKEKCQHFARKSKNQIFYSVFRKLLHLDFF